MAITEIKTITWKCDRCGVKREITIPADQHPPDKPSTWDDPWAWIKIDQDAGWDHHGASWAPRMRHPRLLCGECIEDVIAVLNEKPERS